MLPRRIENTGEDATELRRRTFVIKEIAGEIRVFDEETGDEVHNLSEDLLRRLRSLHPDLQLPSDSRPKPQAEFKWEGDELVREEEEEK